MCSETEEKVILIKLLEFPIFPITVCCCSVSKWSDSAIAEAKWAIGHEKCIFETPHNEIKCVLSIKDVTSSDVNDGRW